ncbi:MAG: helix-turn-helix transcriptional regulator [Sphingomonas sp.]
MSNAQERVLNFFNDAAKCGDLNQLVTDFAGVIGLFGYDSFGYVRLATPGEPVRPSVLFGGISTGWSERYAREQLARHDPTLPLVFAKQAPFAWADVSEATLTKEQKRLFFEAGKAGLTDGFVVPVGGPLGEISAVLMAGNGEAPPKPEDRGTLQALATVFATYGRSLLDLAGDEWLAGEPLTRREAQCLTWVAQGKTDWEIGAILSIAPRTVGTHLDNARAKLGAATRAQAVFEAWRHGLLVEPGADEKYGKRPIH